MNKPILWLLVLSLLLGACTAPTITPVIEQAAPTKEVVVEPTATEAPSPIPTETPLPTAIPTPTPTLPSVSVSEVIEFEMRGSFDFFWEQANTTDGSPGYGLIRDRFPGSVGIASMASVGFGLTAYVIGVEKDYVTYEEAYERANKTMDTLLAMDRVEGFYYHFVDMQTGERAWGSEVSNIDTSILLMGVLTAGEYFGGEVAQKAQQIYDGVNWPWYLDTNRNMFYMSYRPEKDAGFAGAWDFYAEQLMMYILAAGSDTYPIDETPYYAFVRHTAKYGDSQPFIHSWFGSIFTYQFTHAWIDFREYTDKEGVNWFDNSVEAAKASYSFAVNMDEKYLTLGPNAWGLSASDGPNGYNGLYGSPPSGYDMKQHKVDDTIPPYGAIASILFLPDQAKQAMLNYYNYEELKGEYGFKDAYNLTEDWFASDVIGIDKGVSLLMLANYQEDIVYRVIMENENIKAGLERLQIKKGE